MWIATSEGLFNTLGYRAIQAEAIGEDSNPKAARLVGRPLRLRNSDSAPSEFEVIAQFDGPDCCELAEEALEAITGGMLWPAQKVVDLRRARGRCSY